jgi:hypothetical protein
MVWFGLTKAGVIGGGQPNDVKEREIAALKAQLAAAQAPPAPAVAPPEAATPPPDPVLHQPVETGNLTGADLAALLALADGNKAITYSHLKKNAERYKGKEWAFSGPILEIQEANGRTIARINDGYYGESVMWIVAPFETDFVQGKVVDVAGLLAGTYEYKSQAGWDITIPALFAQSIQKRGTFDKVRPRSAHRHHTDDDE